MMTTFEETLARVRALSEMPVWLKRNRERKQEREATRLEKLRPRPLTARVMAVAPEPVPLAERREGWVPLLVDVPAAVLERLGMPSTTR